MALGFIKEKERQKYFLLIFIVLLFAALVLINSGYFRSGQDEVIVQNLVAKPIQINFNLLDSQILKNLQTFNMIPRMDQGYGRQNPYLPY